MSSEWVEKVQRVFNEARAIEVAARPAFLDEACAGDASLRDEVESLLSAAAEPGADFMNSPALGDGFRIVGGSPPIENREASLPKSIGRYRIIRRIGEGGMGVVYEAVQEKTGSTVAVKVIRPGLASRDLLRRFEHEAQVLGRLRHAGIARIYEAGIHSAGDATAPFIAMELIDGPSLLDYVKSESPDVPAILGLFTMICDAVQHAHQKGVVHRDLKPGNILVERTDQFAQPKILDFGIARVTDSDTLTTTQQTQTGQLIGTLKYMSPEQAAGDPSDIDTRSDVYALGVILYELLTRRMPYDVDRKLIHEAVRAIREDEAKPLSSISRLYRGDLTTILGKALEKDKARRYQSASELAADIRRYLNYEPITAHPASAMYQFRKFARRNRGLVLGVAVVFLSLVGGIITTSWQAAVASKARDEAQTARSAEKKQHERAERRFQEVHRITHDLIFSFDALISRLAGSTPAREFLVRKSLDYLTSVAEDLDPNDEQLNAELGTAYFQLGDIQGDPRAPNLGDPDGALKSYLTGLPFIRAMAEVAPDQILRQTALGAAYNRIGQLLMTMGRPDEANAYFELALNHYERQSRAHPRNATVLAALANCYGFKVDAHRREGRFEDAIQEALKALAALRWAIEYEPNDNHARHTLASTSSQIGQILEEQGKLGDSLPYRLECLAIMESLAKDEPHNATYSRDVCNAAERVGFAYQETGDFESALPYFLQTARISEELVAADPKYERFQFHRIVAYLRIGETQLGLGRNAEADKTFRRHLKLCEEYAEPRPDDAAARRQVAVAFYKLADVERARAKDESRTGQQRRDHWSEAQAWLRK
ncbi:MAG: serine/threonine-protein kinase, partial [Planctomycetota bacterium]|nr:serine/threonine-protein kinase [Planctomycetota bacterium]